MEINKIGTKMRKKWDGKENVEERSREERKESEGYARRCKRKNVEQGSQILLF